MEGGGGEVDGSNGVGKNISNNKIAGWLVEERHRDQRTFMGSSLRTFRQFLQLLTELVDHLNALPGSEKIKLQTVRQTKFKSQSFSSDFIGELVALLRSHDASRLPMVSSTPWVKWVLLILLARP